MPQGHVHRLIVAFDRKDLITFQMQIFITVIDYFGYRKEFNTELCTRLLPLVDDPMIPVVVRMDVRMGKFHHVCMAQTRKGAENEDIPVDARSVVGKFDVHHGLQFRSGQITSFGVFGPDMESCKRIDENPPVLIRRIGHQTQFLDPGTDRSGSKTFYRGEVNDELFDKIPIQLFERNVLDVVFVFEESGKTSATQTVILVGGISTIFIDTFEEVRKVFVENLQQAAVIAHTEAGVADLFGRDIRIPIAEALIPFTDILVLIFSNFSLMCWASRLLPAALVSLGIPE